MPCLDWCAEEPDMTAELEQGPNAASPYATGGGGTRLEHRLGAVYLARLLTGGPVFELGERALTRVAFQQSPAARIDDLVVTAASADGMSWVRLDIAVRRTPKFILSDKKTGDLVAALVAADVDAESEMDTQVERRLAVAVSGFQKHAQEISELAVVARSQPTAEEFFALVRTPRKFATRPRLEHLLGMVAAALSESHGLPGSAEQRCWSLLRRLWLMQTQLETGHEDAWTATLDDLRHVAIAGSLDSAAALRDRLEQLAGAFARNAGSVDATTLRRHLHGKLAPGTHVAPVGWARLVELDKQTRSSVTRSIAGQGPTALSLPRTSIRDGLRAALVATGNLLVTGESGVGKSALVMDAIEPDELGKGRQALALNLRHLPRRHIDLLALLLGPLVELLAELTAPERMLIIDSAEAAAEGHSDVFVYLVTAAREAGLKVIAVSTVEGAGTLVELMKRLGEAPRDLAVPGLDDEELREAAHSFPSLQRLVDNSRARELLRRPIVIDLLRRAGDPGLPLSEAQALDHIWHQLVRNGDRRDEGAPDAREQVMLRLADDAVRPGNVDDLLSSLDQSALAGLRRSGLLLPASPLPWERVPKFQHDLVRAYAVARMLLAERDPAAALAARGAPRWTLPAARLACEILLAAPDTPTYPGPGRFAALQNSFDVLVEGGSGQRWSDVPTEAALAVPHAGAVLHDAWPSLVREDGLGVERLVRVLRARHQPDGFLDPAVAEPVVSRLLEPGLLRRNAEDAASLIGDWLRAHVFRGSSAGQSTRIKVRDAILRQCAGKERALDEEQSAREAELAARTPEQIAADEERSRRFTMLSGPRLSGGRRLRTAARRRPYLWIEDSQIEHLALLGPDLGPEGEAILRRIAEDDPHCLEHAVEAVLAGSALAAYDPKFLLDLVEAYYIEHDDEDEDGFGWSDGFFDEGIRHHRSRGGPLASYLYGPFLAMFRADYLGGVALLNRMLDHAARFRVRRSAARGYEMGPDDPFEAGEVLSITGEPRQYAGDGQVWLWYRGTGAGPYPCMSALQALEFVTEEFITADVPPTALTGIMTADAHSLAMPALALAVLVRHLEDVGDALDPYLVEPTVWDLEFSRAIADQMSILGARKPELARPERRGWSLREVGMALALSSDGDRSVELKVIGERLVENVRRELGADSSPGAHQRLAAVRTWALGLDRDAYEIRREDEHVVIQQVADPDAERVLAETNTELRRTNEAVGLVVRHAHVRDSGGRAPSIGPDMLEADLALARALLDSPPQSYGFYSDGPVAVAATAVELHLTGRAALQLDDLAWSATTLLQVAIAVADGTSEASEESIFGQGADLSAARALPFLLLPAAQALRVALSGEGPDDIGELIAISRALAVGGNHETRLAFARSLDSVWAAPCDFHHLHGHCHHRVAFEIVVESVSESVFGQWDQALQRRTLARLDPPLTEALETVAGEDIHVLRLNPGLRAAGAAAATRTCCGEDARLALRTLLAAHQRGMLASEHGHHHSDSDSLVAARAALWQASTDDGQAAIQYIRNYLPNSRLLAEGLGCLAAAAEERPDAGEHARRLWPQIMDVVLDAADGRSQIFAEHPWGDYCRANLIPNRSAGRSYLTTELVGDPYPWRDMPAWKPQIDRWVRSAAPRRMSLDHLVIAVRDLDVDGQIELGLPWIEETVSASGPDCASTYTLPEWLHERRSDLTAEADIARWQRVVDHLVVAGDTRVADLAD